MSDLYIHIVPEDPFKPHGLRVNPIEDNKHPDEEGKGQKRSSIIISKKDTIQAFLLNNLNSLLKCNKRKGITKLSDLSTIELFEKLYRQLNLLCTQDLSTDYQFAHDLSEIWEEFTTFFIPYTLKRIRSEKATNAIEQLQNMIKQHPPNSSHSLGYYLIHHAGDSWLPFPFIEIIRNLHEEYIACPANCALQKMLDCIQRIIKELTSIDTPQKK